MTQKERAARFKETWSLAELMTMAIDDMEALVDNELYIFQAYDWHIGSNYHSECSICLAGAVMANRLGATPSKSVSPDDYDRDTRLKLQALNCTRGGHLSLAHGQIQQHDDTSARIARKYLGYEFKINVPKYNFYDKVSGRVFIKFWRDEGIELLKTLETNMGV